MSDKSQGFSTLILPSCVQTKARSKLKRCLFKLLKHKVNIWIFPNSTEKSLVILTYGGLWRSASSSASSAHQPLIEVVLSAQRPSSPSDPAAQSGGHNVQRWSLDVSLTGVTNRMYTTAAETNTGLDCRKTLDDLNSFSVQQRTFSWVGGFTSYTSGPLRSCASWVAMVAMVLLPHKSSWSFV